MQRDPRAFLWDVREAALAIQTFTKGMDVSAYENNALVQAAVERKFEVIGEALNQLSKLDPAMAAQLPDLPQIVAFRNPQASRAAFLIAQTHTNQKRKPTHGCFLWLSTTCLA